jgi:glutaredoxin
MEVTLIGTRDCRHCPILKKWFQDHKVDYTMQYVEDHPELVDKYEIQKSPTLIIDGELKFVGMPSFNDLKKALHIE